MSAFGEIYTTRKIFYTACGSDGSDKSHLCVLYSDLCKHARLMYLFEKYHRPPCFIFGPPASDYSPRHEVIESAL